VNWNLKGIHDSLLDNAQLQQLECKSGVKGHLTVSVDVFSPGQKTGSSSSRQHISVSISVSLAFPFFSQELMRI